jgi:hypothetical protein
MSKSLLLGNQKIMAKERERERFERARVLVMHHSWGFAREMVTKIAWIVCGGEEREESKWCRKLDCVCGERERERGWGESEEIVKRKRKMEKRKEAPDTSR